MGAPMSKKTNISPNIWKDVKYDIETKILSGFFAPGERIPSIRKIADDYGVGQTTAQKVLNVLWQEGIIEPRRGVGFFVKPYIREQLITERKKELERKLISVVEEASMINVDLFPMLEKYIQMKNGQK